MHITCLIKYNLLQRQLQYLIITKSLNQYPNINAQTSDESQPLETYENSTNNLDEVLLSKQASNIDLFFNRGRHDNIDIYYMSQSIFISQKKQLVII